MITVYHNPRCCTSRKALEFIEQHSDDEVTIIRYLDTPPSEQSYALYLPTPTSARTTQSAPKKPNTKNSVLAQTPPNQS